VHARRRRVAADGVERLVAVSWPRSLAPTSMPITASLPFQARASTVAARREDLDVDAPPAGVDGGRAGTPGPRRRLQARARGHRAGRAQGLATLLPLEPVTAPVVVEEV
jgi:hypothetical protein